MELSYGGEDYGRFPDRYAMAGSVSYITGTHNMKVGIQDTWGSYRRTDTANGDIRAVFLQRRRYDGNDPELAGRAVRPGSCRRRRVRAGQLDAEAHDGELRRAVRALRERHPGRDVAGRPLHRGAHVRADRHADMEQHLAARRALSTTCSATRRRPLKFSIGRYEQAGTTGFSESYNPLQLTTAQRRLDRPEPGRRPAGRAWLRLPDAPAARSTSRSCRKASAWPAWRTSIPNIKRMYNVETAISLQQELRPGVSVQGGWYHRDFHNLRRRDNTLQTFADYTPFTLYSPIDGTPITYYNVSAAARSRDQLRGHDRRRRPEDVVQRLRVQLQRPAAAAASRCSAAA